MLEELADGYTGPLKLQVTGPWTLAATVELPRGDKVLADHGARRDLAEALAYGLQEHVAEVRRRVPGAELVVQLDEPALPAVLAGAVPTASGWGKHRSVDGPGAVELLTPAIEAVAPAITLVHCCAARPPIEVFPRPEPGEWRWTWPCSRMPAWEQIAFAVEDGDHPVRRGGADDRPCSEPRAGGRVAGPPLARDRADPEAISQRSSSPRRAASPAPRRRPTPARASKLLRGSSTRRRSRRRGRQKPENVGGRR